VNRDELAEKILQAWDTTKFDTYPGTTMASVAADTAIAALAPKLAWTEWESITHTEQVSVLMIGQIKVAFMVKDQFGAHGGVGDGPILVAPGNDETAIAALRTGIERRVREALEGKP
jgi:hypothetical protein